MGITEQELLDIIRRNPFHWEKLKGRSVMVVGASGQIGQVIVGVLMALDQQWHYECRVNAVSRNRAKAERLFAPYLESPYFAVTAADVNQGAPAAEDVDYIIHAASNTHPRQYREDPIGTITTNVFGTYHLLELAAEKDAEFLLLSSVEIYGDDRSDGAGWSEQDMGYLDCAAARAGYPESKRVAESMCYAFREQKGSRFKIARLARVYGPTMTDEDTKASSQFFRMAMNGEDIVLKSAGNQLFSYVYLTDCVAGIFAVLLNAEDGEVVNVSGTESAVTLRELAERIAAAYGVHVVGGTADAAEQASYSKASRAVMKNDRLIALGWQERTPIDAGIRRMRELP